MKLKLSSFFKIFLISIVILGVFLLIDYKYRLNQVSKLFWQAEKNTPRSTIEALLGPPDLSDHCGDNIWWGDDRSRPAANNGLCQVWVRYNFFLESFAFGYSEKGLLVSKYHYQSE